MPSMTTASPPPTTTTAAGSAQTTAYTYKGKVTFRSWPQLPHELVRQIATLYLLDASASNYCPRVWDKRELWHSRMLYAALRDTAEMEKVMSVCPQWSLALETHLFWQQAVSLLDPLDFLAHHALIQPPQHQASHTTSTAAQQPPVRISPYRHFRTIAAYSCIVCRINSPGTSLGLNSIARNHATPYLGTIGLCAEHEKRTTQFCGLCLREGGFTETDFESWIGTGGLGGFYGAGAGGLYGIGGGLGMVNFTQAHQQALLVGCVENEDKTLFPGVHATCRSCRKEHLWIHASLNPNDILALGASPGASGTSGSGLSAHPSRPLSPTFEPADWETRQVVESFIEMAEGEIKDVLMTAREKFWLRKYTRLADMLSQAVAAQKFNSGVAVVPEKSSSKSRGGSGKASTEENSRRARANSAQRESPRRARSQSQPQQQQQRQSQYAHRSGTWVQTESRGGWVTEEFGMSEDEEEDEEDTSWDSSEVELDDEDEAAALRAGSGSGSGSRATATAARSALKRDSALDVLDASRGKNQKRREKEKERGGGSRGGAIYVESEEEEGDYGYAHEHGRGRVYEIEEEEEEEEAVVSSTKLAASAHQDPQGPTQAQSAGGGYLKYPHKTLADYNQALIARVEAEYAAHDMALTEEELLKALEVETEEEGAQKDSVAMTGVEDYDQVEATAGEKGAHASASAGGGSSSASHASYNIPTATSSTSISTTTSNYNPANLAASEDLSAQSESDAEISSVGSGEEDDPEMLQAVEENGVKELALGDWARMRVLDGFWISPADLWYGHAVPGAGVESVGAVHPVRWAREGEESEGEEAGVESVEVVEVVEGSEDEESLSSYGYRQRRQRRRRASSTRQRRQRHKLRHPTVETMMADMPPSYELCEQAYSAHLQQMRVVLLNPMRNVVRKMVMEYQDAVGIVWRRRERERERRLGLYGDGDIHVDEDEVDEEVDQNELKSLLMDPAIKAARMTLEDVVRLLREEEGVWFDGVDWIEKRRNERMLKREQEREERRGSRVGAANDSIASELTPSASGSPSNSSSSSSSSGPECSSSTGPGSSPNSTTSPVLSTSTLQTTPSPPPSVDDRHGHQKSKGVAGNGDGTPRVAGKRRPQIGVDTDVHIDVDLDVDHQDHASKPRKSTGKSSYRDEGVEEWTPAKVTIPISPVLNPPRLLRPIPYVPTSIAHLPQYSIEALNSVWREACAALFHCRCKICERAAAKANAEAAARASSGQTQTTTTSTAATATTATSTATGRGGGNANATVATPVRAADVDYVNQRTQQAQQPHSYPPVSTATAQGQQYYQQQNQYQRAPQQHQLVQIQLEEALTGEQEDNAKFVLVEEEEEEELDGVDARRVRYEEEEEEEEEEDLEEVDVDVESEGVDLLDVNAKSYEPISPASTPKMAVSAATTDASRAANPDSGRSRKRSIDDVHRADGGRVASRGGADHFDDENESGSVEAPSRRSSHSTSASAISTYDSGDGVRKRTEGTPSKKLRRLKEHGREDVGSDIEEEDDDEIVARIRKTGDAIISSGEGALTPSRRRSNRAHGADRQRHHVHQGYHQRHRRTTSSSISNTPYDDEPLSVLSVIASADSTRGDGGDSTMGSVAGRPRKRSSEELDDDVGGNHLPSRDAITRASDASGDDSQHISNPYYPHHLVPEVSSTNHNQALVPSPLGGNGNKRYKVASLTAPPAPPLTSVATVTSVPSIGTGGAQSAVPRMSKTVWLTSNGSVAGEELTKASAMQVGDVVVVTKEGED